MSGKDLVLADSLFVIVAIMIYETDGLKAYPIILKPLIVIAFLSCVIRHINYYKLTKRIY
jgi:cytochrome c oxidase subunit IV